MKKKIQNYIIEYQEIGSKDVRFFFFALFLSKKVNILNKKKKEKKNPAEFS